jgi:hypothetical protein
MGSHSLSAEEANHISLILEQEESNFGLPEDPLSGVPSIPPRTQFSGSRVFPADRVSTKRPPSNSSTEESNRTNFDSVKEDVAGLMSRIRAVTGVATPETHHFISSSPRRRLEIGSPLPPTPVLPRVEFLNREEQSDVLQEGELEQLRSENLKLKKELLGLKSGSNSKGRNIKNSSNHCRKAERRKKHLSKG